MVFGINWTQRATEELHAILRLIIRDNPTAALRLGERIYDRVDRLSTQPHLGTFYRGRPKGQIRELYEAPCRIFYRVEESLGTIAIVSIWHAAREEPPL